MNVLTAPVLAFVVAALSIAFPASAEPTPCRNRSSAPQDFQNCLFSRLLGSRVENQDGQRVGQLKDSVIDLGSGKVECNIVTSGGLFGWGRRSSLVPADSLTTATAKKGVLGLNLPRQEWQEAPLLHSDDLAEVNRAHLRLRASSLPRNHKAIVGRSGSLSPTGPVRAHGGAHRVNLRLASDLLGKTVMNLQATRLGKISDLLLDFDDGKPGFAVLTRHGFLRRTEKFVVPLKSLSDDASGRLVVELKENQLAHAPAFTVPVWQAAAGNSGTLVFRLSLSAKGHRSTWAVPSST